MTERDFQSMKAVLRTRRKFRICEAVCRMEAREDGRDENMFAVVPCRCVFDMDALMLEKVCAEAPRKCNTL